MAKVEFEYNGMTTIVQCKENQKMIEIFNKFIYKAKLKDKEICYLYNGRKISNPDYKLTFNEIANSIDVGRKTMNILVYDINDKCDNKSIIRAKKIICPKCYENAKIRINNYKINLFGCKNKHIISNILFNKFENTQMLNLDNIKCAICKDNRSNKYKYEFYKCSECNMNLCPLCKNIHNKKHNIYNYDKIDYICMKHKEIYINYCKECNQNKCLLCEKEHYEHENISFIDMMIDKRELSYKIEKLKNSIIIFNKYINKIKYVIDIKKENNKNLYKLKTRVYKVLQQIISAENILNEIKKNYELKYTKFTEVKKANQKKFKELIKYVEKLGHLKEKGENMLNKISIRKSLEEITPASIAIFRNIKKGSDNIPITLTLELASIIYLRLTKNKILEKIDWKEARNYIVKQDFISIVRKATTENLGPKLIGFIINILENSGNNWNIKKIKDISKETGILAEFIESLLLYDKDKYKHLILGKEKIENAKDLEINEYNKIIEKKNEIENNIEQLKIEYDELTIELNNINKEIEEIKNNMKINENILANLKNEKDKCLERLNTNDNIINLSEYFSSFIEFYYNFHNKNVNDRLVKTEKNDQITDDNNNIKQEELIISKILETIQENIEHYYKINEYILTNYNEKERNYELLYNINEIYKCNIINDILKIDNNSENKFNIIFNIYEQIIRQNEIKLSLKIGKEDINKNIYFLDNTNGDIIQNGKKEENHNFFKELNESNVELYINNNKYKYKKYFRPDKEGIYEILLKINTQIKDCSYMFFGCSNIINIDLSVFDTKNVSDMSYMFYECNNLTNIDLISFDTRNVNNMRGMFFKCSKLTNIDISSFDTNNVKNMNHMFSGCSSLSNIDISSFNTKNINNAINMDYMFYNCPKLKEIKIDKNSYEKIKEQLKEIKINII